ncbi:uncharacterized protein [Centroberyx affinis]|uniref:uncharacterized protein isoform X2 n=1 Tax=Centroberyx affinis TaxID=166261 RepID=UPI003A5B9518
MAEFRRTKITLCLILVFHVTAVTGQRSPSSYVRDGDEVTLPCENVTPSHDKCDYTAWIFNHFINKDTVELVTGGKIASNQFAKPKAARLSVSANCSLVIKKVTVEDVGLYTCRQFMSGQRIRPDAAVYLSLVNTVTEQEDTDKLMLSCSVVRYGECRETLMWLYEGVKWNRNISNILISQSTCHTTVSFLSSIYVKERFQCEVTDRHSRTVQMFDFTSLSSGTKATTTTKSTIATTTKETGPRTKSTPNSKPEAYTDCSVLNYVMLALRVAELFLITVITALLIRSWRRARGNQTPPDDNIVHNDDDDDDGTVNYDDIEAPSASVLFH